MAVGCVSILQLSVAESTRFDFVFRYVASGRKTAGKLEGVWLKKYTPSLRLLQKLQYYLS